MVGNVLSEKSWSTSAMLLVRDIPRCAHSLLGNSITVTQICPSITPLLKARSISKSDLSLIDFVVNRFYSQYLKKPCEFVNLTLVFHPGIVSAKYVAKFDKFMSLKLRRMLFVIADCLSHLLKCVIFEHFRTVSCIVPTFLILASKDYERTG